MIKKRLFIAINLSDETKEKLFSLSKDWNKLPIKQTKKENFHITLLFLGYFPGEKFEKLKETIKKSCQRLKPFEVKIMKVEYFPLGFKKPKMVWVKLDDYDNLLLSRNLLKKEIEKLKNENFTLKKEEKFIPHINLGRIDQYKFNFDEIPIINENLNLKIQINSIELMESHLKREGPEYVILESFPFLRKSNE